MIRFIRDKLTELAKGKDGLRLFTFFAIYFTLWIVLAAYLPQSAERDSNEQVVWSQSWQWGYYKHPPLTSALLHAVNILFGGPSLGIIAFAAQGCSLVALFYVGLHAKQMLSKKLAIIAVLLTSLIAYHNFRALTFNHNTVSLPFTAAAWYYFYCGIRCPKKLSNWLWLGLVCGLAMLTKYSAVMILASIFVVMVWQRLWTTSVILGLLVSSVVFLVTVSPNLIWLIDNHWLPFSYLQEELTGSSNRLSIFAQFIATQFVRLSYLLPTLLGIGYLSKRGIIKGVSSQSSHSSREKDDLHYLLIILFTPLILSLMPLLLSGSFVNSNWVSAFFLPVGIVITKCCLHRLEEAQLLKRTYQFAALTHVIIWGVFFLASAVYPSVTGKKDRSNFPNQALAKKVTEIWSQQQREPLAILISDTWTGGNLLLRLRPEPTLLIDNDPQKSPWVSAHDLATCGALILFPQSEMTANTYSALFDQASTKGEFLLTWGKAPRGEVVHFIWGIKPALPNEGPCRLRP